MGLLLKMFSVTEIVTGILTIFLQICQLIIFRSNNALKEPDIVSVGVWGGTFLVLFGVILMSKRLRDSLVIQGLAVYGILIGITIIGLYSWSINRYQYAVPDCNFIAISNVTLCARVALDSLLIMCGIMVVGLNLMVTVMASSFAKD